MKQTPQEYSQSLFENYLHELSGVPKTNCALIHRDDSYYKSAVQCALIDVQNTIDALESCCPEYVSDVDRPYIFCPDCSLGGPNYDHPTIFFFKEVKQILEEKI